ncbi:hypothetical protein Trydic_g6713 [Trypoxylus dichotomus]
MFLADTLSRSFIKDQVMDDPELENIVHSVSKHLSVIPERRKDFQEATMQDPKLQKVIKYHMEGWPNKKCDLPVEVKDFWKYRGSIDLT